MTKQTYTETIDNSTDANFRVWATNLHNALNACGLVQTTDTGQINLATVTRPGGTFAYSGYEIYRFNDSLQSTKPIFIKVEYGVTSPVTNPAIRVSIGTGTNGAGTLTGITQLPQGSATLAPAAGNTSQTWCTHTSDGAFVLVWGTKIQSNSAPNSRCATLVVIDRSRDDTGAATNEGATFSVTDNARTLSQYTLQFSATPTLLASGAAQCLIPNAATSSMVGTDVQLYKHWMSAPRVRPMVALLTYFDTEIGAGTTFSASPFGTARTYLPLGSLLGPIGTSQTAAAAHVLAVLWED